MRNFSRHAQQFPHTRPIYKTTKHKRDFSEKEPEFCLLFCPETNSICLECVKNYSIQMNLMFVAITVFLSSVTTKISLIPYRSIFYLRCTKPDDYHSSTIGPLIKLNQIQTKCSYFTLLSGISGCLNIFNDFSQPETFLVNAISSSSSFTLLVLE